MATPKKFMGELLDDWQRLRTEIRAIEESEHPPLIDRHGREWVWRDGDLYAHDNTLAMPKHMVENPNLGLPSQRLADNPNYAALCATCTRDWENPK